MQNLIHRDLLCETEAMDLVSKINKKGLSACFTIVEGSLPNPIAHAPRMAAWTYTLTAIMSGVAVAQFQSTALAKVATGPLCEIATALADWDKDYYGEAFK